MNRDVLRRTETPAGPASGVYICPEHPEIMTTTASKCGKCGKDLVPKKQEQVLYTCPDHKEIITTTPAKCGVSGCGKDLVPKK
jgi:Cu+-exporting ATPase